MAEKLKMICNFCALGCSIYLNKDQPLQIDVKASKDCVCPRAFFNLELLQHPNRLKYPLFFGQKSTYKNIVLDIRQRLSEKTGFFLGPNLTLEETALAIILAGHCGTNKIALAIPEDEKSSFLKNRVNSQDLIDAEVILAIGDPIENSPALSKKISKARIINIDNRRGISSKIAKTSLICDIGQTATTLNGLVKALQGFAPKSNDAESEITSIAKTLRKSKKVGVITSTGFGHFFDPERIIALSRQIANILGENCFFLSLSTGANSRGIQRLLKVNKLGDLEKLVSSINSGRIETLFMLGCDIKQTIPNVDLSKVRTRIQTTILPTSSTREMTHVIPSRLLGEKTGNLLSLHEHIRKLNNNILSTTAFSEENFLRDLLQKNYEIDIKDIAGQLTRYCELKIQRKAVPIFDEFVMAGYLPVGHHNDGAITDHFLMNKNAKKYVKISDAIAQKFKLEDGDSISIFANSPMLVKIDKILQDNLILVPVSNSNARCNFNSTFQPDRVAFTKVERTHKFQKNLENTPYNFQIVHPQEQKTKKNDNTTSI